MLIYSDGLFDSFTSWNGRVCSIELAWNVFDIGREKLIDGDYSPCGFALWSLIVAFYIDWSYYFLFEMEIMNDGPGPLYGVAISEIYISLLGVWIIFNNNWTFS